MIGVVEQDPQDPGHGTGVGVHDDAAGLDHQPPPIRAEPIHELAPDQAHEFPELDWLAA